MNWQQFQAYVWLRWRLLANQWRRGGAVNAVLMTIVAVGLLAMAIPICIGCFVLGWYLFPDARPVSLLYAWDAICVAFVFCWGIGLLADMQQTESLAVTKFLHLPVSVGGAFAINYLSSLVCLTMVLFLPVLLGLSASLVFAKGGLMLLVMPLTAAFLLMITALSNQFQGWLATLMSNPRRRRTVVAGATALVILISQAPNLINIYRPWGSGQNVKSQAYVEELAELDRAFKAQEIDFDQFNRRSQQANEKYSQEIGRSNEENVAFWDRTISRANLLLPIGWLPLGVKAAAEGNALPALLGTVAMTLIGGASLWRAYRTTMRHYQGQFSAKPRRAAAPPAAVSVSTIDRAGSSNPIESHLPGLSEPVSAILLASLRSLARSPEAKMMLLTPLIMGGVFASIALKAPRDMPELARPLLGIGAIMVVLFGLLQLMSNQFGFDRNGFRVFVLCAAPRRDILLGKNLSFVPLVGGLSAIMLICTQMYSPMRFTHLLSMAPQFVSMFLLFAILMNFMSIYTPFPLAAGSAKPAKPKLTVVLMQMLLFCALFPLSQLPTLLPLGIEALLDSQGWTAGLPICLALAIAECAAVVWLYRRALQWQGKLLQNGEQRILEVVTGRAA